MKAGQKGLLYLCLTLQHPILDQFYLSHLQSPCQPLSLMPALEVVHFEDPNNSCHLWKPWLDNLDNSFSSCRHSQPFHLRFNSKPSVVINYDSSNICSLSKPTAGCSYSGLLSTSHSENASVSPLSSYTVTGIWVSCIRWKSIKFRQPRLFMYTSLHINDAGAHSDSIHRRCMQSYKIYSYKIACASLQFSTLPLSRNNFLPLTLILHLCWTKMLMMAISPLI